VLRDRRQLSQEGFIVCIVAVDEYDGEIIYGPEIISRGFVYMREQEDLIRRAQEAVSKVVKKKSARVCPGKQDQGRARQLRRPRDRPTPDGAAARDRNVVC
jgi:mRNA degradation ribonuclease J1/J2